jgi:thiamine biosynthesis protein ThiS
MTRFLDLELLHSFAVLHSSYENPFMRIQINGEGREFDGALLLAALIEQLGMKADRVAVELNRNIVPRSQWADTTVAEGDQLEIVQFVGGGWR